MEVRDNYWKTVAKEEKDAMTQFVEMAEDLEESCNSWSGHTWTMDHETMVASCSLRQQYATMVTSCSLRQQYTFFVLEITTECFWRKF